MLQYYNQGPKPKVLALMHLFSPSRQHTIGGQKSLADGHIVPHLLLRLGISEGLAHVSVMLYNDDGSYSYRNIDIGLDDLSPFAQAFAADPEETLHNYFNWTPAEQKPTLLSPLVKPISLEAQQYADDLI